MIGIVQITIKLPPVKNNQTNRKPTRIIRKFIRTYRRVEHRFGSTYAREIYEL